mmetsp:Transcript_14552/g.36441  ORF Transcript_14552/g.36441 Transcript_14552/m.36441 type:complete len:214 (+) Transcript_14552:469-1110(+)
MAASNKCTRCTSVMRFRRSYALGAVPSAAAAPLLPADARATAVARWSVRLSKKTRCRSSSESADARRRYPTTRRHSGRCVAFRRRCSRSSTASRRTRAHASATERMTRESGCRSTPFSTSAYRSSTSSNASFLAHAVISSGISKSSHSVPCMLASLLCASLLLAASLAAPWKVEHAFSRRGSASFDSWSRLPLTLALDVLASARHLDAAMNPR